MTILAEALWQGEVIRRAHHGCCVREMFDE